MCDGYDDAPDPGPAGRSELDEFLAEYVDGSMDPCVRAVFEELMQVNPEVAERVCYLKHVRSELCQLNCQCQAPVGFEQRLRQQLAFEMMREEAPVGGEVAEPLRLTTVLASLVLLLALAGTAYENAFREAPVPVVEQSMKAPLEEALPERSIAPQPLEASFTPAPEFSQRVSSTFQLGVVRTVSMGRDVWPHRPLSAHSTGDTLGGGRYQQAAHP